MPEDRLQHQVSGKTDAGKVRSRNEDDYCIRFIGQDHPDQTRLLIAVADGMGGGPAGHLASGTAIEILERHVMSSDEAINQPDNILVSAFHEANKLLHQSSQEDERYSGMGTTLTAAIVKDNVAIIAHVGDSKAYLVREGQIHQITQDHSLVADQVKRGDITPKEARVAPHRNVITRSIGTDPEIAPEIYQQRLEEGDGLVLCTDGLSDLVEDTEILAIMLNTRSVEQACEHLVELANQRGGHDNTTVICLEFGELSRLMGIREHAPTTPLEPRRIRKLLIALVAIVFLLALTIGSYLIYSKHREGVPEDRSIPPSIEDSSIGNSED